MQEIAKEIVFVGEGGNRKRLPKDVGGKGGKMRPGAKE